MKFVIILLAIFVVFVDSIMDCDPCEPYAVPFTPPPENTFSPEFPTLPPTQCSLELSSPCWCRSLQCSADLKYHEPLVLLTKWRPKRGNSRTSKETHGDRDSLLSLWWYYPKLNSNLRLATTYIINGEPAHNTLDVSSSIGVNHSTNQLVGTLDKYNVNISDGNQLLYSISFDKKKRSQWMFNRKYSLGDFTLAELVIPGTHESTISTSYDVGESRPGRTFYQSKNITEQLTDGIRYLELQPVHVEENSQDKYNVMLDCETPVSMDGILKEIKDFINSSPDIVIVSINTKGLRGKDDHRDFMKYLERNLGSYAYPRQRTVPQLNDFWDSNKKLLLIYRHLQYKYSTILWPMIPQYKENFGSSEKPSTQSTILSDATSFICQHGQSNSGQESKRNLHAIIASSNDNEAFSENDELEPHVAANNLFTAYFNVITGAGNSIMNIYAVDNYEVTGVIDLAIQLNDQRARKRELCRNGIY